MAIGKNLKIARILFIAISLLLLADLALIIADQLTGTEKGVIFGYKIFDLIYKSNALVIVFLFILLLLYVAIKYSEKLKIFVRNIAISLFSVFIVVILIEITFFVLIKIKNKPYPYAYETHDYSLFRSDPILGYAANKNITASYQKILIDPLNPNTKDTNFVFNTRIKTDSLGYRLIDIPNMQSRNKYALFFGCSFTFGLGVQDDETTPYYFAKNDTGYCVYNFAITGYGTQSMLAQLQYNNLKKSVKQDSGVCFYIYMNSHPYRVIGDMKTYTTYGHDLPYYNYKKDSIYYYGLFKNDRFLLSSLYTLLSKSNFIKYFNINFPPKLKPKHYVLTCDIIYKAYQEYKKQFKNDNFYVIVYPSNSEILEYLKKYDIKVLDFSKIFNSSDRQYCISKYDQHPSALANKILAEHLIKTLKTSK